MNFIQGDEFELPFEIVATEPDGSQSIVELDEVSGILYEAKTNRVIQKYLHGTPEAPNQPEADVVAFHIKREHTLRCTPGAEYYFDIYVGSERRTFKGLFGVCEGSPIVKEVTV